MQNSSRAFVFLFLLVAGFSSPANAGENSWVEIRSPHFTVFSDAGEKQARRATHDFEKFHAVIRSFIPSLQVNPSIPTIVFAAKNEGTLKSLLPQYWAEKGRARPSGIFVGGAEKNYVALRLDLEDDYRYHVIYHEYVHLLMRLNYPPLPVWLDEGLAECFGYALISDESSIVGSPSPLQLEILRNERPLSIADLFSVDHESPYYREESKASIFYAQSWALTHMLLLGEKRKHAPKLLKYLELIRKDGRNSASAQQALGDLTDLERQLNEYILHLAFYAFEVKTPHIKDTKEYVARKVSFLDFRAVEGDFFLSMKLWARAADMLESVLLSDPKNAEALTSMGVFYSQQNNNEEAARYFIAAAGAGSKSCLTHYHAGRASVVAGDYESAEGYFRKAISINPEFAPAYSGLAGVLSMNNETAPTALTLAVKAIELEPGILSHQLVLANVLLRMGRVDMAVRYAEKVQAAAETDSERMEAKRLLDFARRYNENDAGTGNPDNETRKGFRTTRTSRDAEDAAPGEEAARKRRRDAVESALEEAEREEQRILKQRADAYEKRLSIEKEYLAAVNASRSNGTVTLEGIVSRVHCFDPAGIELTVESAGAGYRFHIANYYEIRFLAREHKPDGELNPCENLYGSHVDVEYIATPGAAYDGEIQLIGIYKSERQEQKPETRDQKPADR